MPVSRPGPAISWWGNIRFEKTFTPDLCRLLAASGLVGLVAMPCLAALLIVVGVQTVKPARIRSVMGSGALQTAWLGRPWLAVVPPQAATTRLITAIGASHRCLVMLSSAVR